MRETTILQQCRLDAHKYDITIFRNNTGKLEDKRGRWVSFGLCEGSADLVGYHNRTGKFLAFEVKVPGKKPTKAQTNFINAVNKAGGIAGVVYCSEDMGKLLDT